MSFGVGVGDVIAVSQLAKSLWKSFNDSGDQFMAISTECALPIEASVRFR